MENIQELAVKIDRFLIDADFYSYADDGTTYEKVLDCITDKSGAENMIEVLSDYDDNPEVVQLIQQLSVHISNRD